MAKFIVEFPDSIYEKFAKMGANSDKIIEKMLKVGGQAAFKITKPNLQNSIGKGKYSRPTGQLANSLGISPVKVDSNGISNIKVGFNEPRRPNKTISKNVTYYLSNALVANVLEYGKRGQPARPWMRPSKKALQATVKPLMEQEFYKEIDKI
ncbi:MAG: HK97 gp10 family phage protein [Oscillospiraceae bacterium]|jgi:hypothetical protein|nr:HK97 gp10 family phage protein [Oscillospiraceae bacterium]